MTIGAVLLVFGMLLLLIGILGGGFEMKELKIPKVGPLPRVIAFKLSILFLLLGTSMILAEFRPYDDGTSVSGASEGGSSTGVSSTGGSSSVDFKIYDELGPSQISEQVTVLIDGRLVGTITVNEYYPSSVMNVTVPRSGQHSYTIEAQAVFYDQGQVFEYTGAGQGMIDVEEGKEFYLVATISGSTWLVSLVER